MFQEASNVVGQLAFTEGLANQGATSPNATTLSTPTGVAISPDGSLMFIADFENRRVLGYRGLPASRGQAATMVLGRSDFTTGGFIDSPSSLNGTGGAAIGHGVIAVADPIRLRVLIYPIPSADGATSEPIAVVGKRNINDFSMGCDRQTVSIPADVHITPDGKLIVADHGGHRVLIWNEVPRTDGAPADAVLGQQDFNSCSRNAGGGLTPSRASMNRPNAVWSDGTRLAVADRDNHRVLIWDRIYDDGGAVRLPDRVLGKSDFDTRQPAPSDAATVEPTGVAFNGTHLAATSDHRVLLWNAWPSQNMQPANTVVGQPNFEASGPNAGFPGPTDQTLLRPSKLSFHQDKLLVVDSGNNRVLIFKSD